MRFKAAETAKDMPYTASDAPRIQQAKANAESVIAGIGDSGRRSGGSDEEEVILGSLCSKGSARAGGYRA